MTPEGVAVSTNPSIPTAGHVCLCEWSGPVTVAMVVALLSQLKQVQGDLDALVLILNIRESSAKSIMHRSSTFIYVLPALWAYCQEIVIACQGENALLDQVRRHLCGSTSTPEATLARPLSFFELLDDAFSHVEGVYPHDVLELRRQRLRSGTWLTASTARNRAVE